MDSSFPMWPWSQPITEGQRTTKSCLLSPWTPGWTTFSRLPCNPSIVISFWPIARDAHHFSHHPPSSSSPISWKQRHQQKTLKPMGKAESHAGRGWWQNHKQDMFHKASTKLFQDRERADPRVWAFGCSISPMATSLRTTCATRMQAIPCSPEPSMQAYHACQSTWPGTSTSDTRGRRREM